MVGGRLAGAVISAALLIAWGAFGTGRVIVELDFHGPPLRRVSPPMGHARSERSAGPLCGTPLVCSLLQPVQHEASQCIALGSGDRDRDADSQDHEGEKSPCQPTVDRKEHSDDY